MKCDDNVVIIIAKCCCYEMILTDQVLLLVPIWWFQSDGGSFLSSQGTSGLRILVCSASRLSNNAFYINEHYVRHCTLLTHEIELHDCECTIIDGQQLLSTYVFCL